MEDFQQLFQYILSGLANGAIYALIGFGFAIIYNATGIINFAQGEFVMLGGMLTFSFCLRFICHCRPLSCWPFSFPHWWG